MALLTALRRCFVTTTEWHPATLVQRTKGGNWQTQMTVPRWARAAFGRNQHRKSAGTTDRRIAEAKMHDIEAQMRAEIMSRYEAANLWDHESVYRKAVEILGLEKTFYRGEWVNDMADVVEIPLSHPPQNDGDKRLAFEAIQNVARQAQANCRSPQSIDLADLETIRRNGFKRPTEEEIENLLKGLRKVLLNERPKAEQTIEDLLPQFTTHLESRVKNGSLKRKTMKEWLTFVPQFVKTVGNLALSDVQQKHAYDFAKLLESEGKGEKTIKSRVSGVSQLMQFAAVQGLIDRNPLYRLRLKGIGTKSEHQRPLNDEQLSALFNIDGLPIEVRILWAILITTGMRIDEAALLRVDQIRLEEIPYFDLRAAEVKTARSERQVPIPEVILPTIHMLKANPSGEGGRLLDYTVNANGKSNASQKCSRWRAKVDLYAMASKGRGKFTTHSMRGSIKDKLRNAAVPLDVSNDLCGHDDGSVANSYGYGTPLRILKETVDKIDHPYLKGLCCWQRELS